MNVSSTVGSALTSATNSGGSVHQAVALAAFKSALQSQAAVLQLFEQAVVPPPSSGRGQVVNISA